MENDTFEEQLNSASKITKANISKINTATKSFRPETPHIDLLAIRNIRKNEPEQIIKNFSSLVKQIIDTENEKFLNGEINLIEYIISKYTNVNISNLNELEKLSLKINAEFGLLNQFGQKLPNLKELRLNGSNIISISSIGSEFKNLRILQINNCNIKDLSGMVCFSSLEVLEAQKNKIDDLIELEMCSSLKILNLKNNFIKEEDNIFFLSSLTNLKYLNLNGNPIQNNENYKKLVSENLDFVENVDIDEIESPKLNSKKINDLINSPKHKDDSLDVTNGSKDTNNQSKINSSINFSEGNNSLRPPSSSTSNNFYKNEKNSFVPFNCKNNILDSNQMTKTAINWKHNNIEKEVNNNTDSNQKVLQGIKSILSQNKKSLNDISIIENENNDINNSFSNNFDKSINVKGFSETARIFSCKGIGINPLKPVINMSSKKSLTGIDNIEIKPVIKKPVILKSVNNNSQTNNNGEISSNKIFINNPSILNNDLNPSKINNNVIKLKKEGNQNPLKPVIIKKIGSHTNNNEINESTNIEDSNLSININSDKKIIFKNKPIIMKSPNVNSSLVDETSSPKKIFLNPVMLKSKDPNVPIKINKIANTVKIQIDDEEKK